MLDVKGDKGLWFRVNLEHIGTVLEVEESYYDGIVDLIEKQQKRIEQLEKGYKDILSWGLLGSAYSDISAAFTFQDIARKALAGGSSDVGK